MENIKKRIQAHIPSKTELLSFKYNSRSSFIKIVIDSIDDISINDTAELARDIKNDDYILSNFPDGLKLEVGTPGVGSELERVFQYEKNIGRNIELKYHRGSEIIKKTYLLIGVEKNGIVVEKDNKKDDILFNEINSAKIKVSFD
tara:strand:+ start:307 stop:741 length:435 start_codon:yes stop_codon:yes gene_type:complete